MYPQIPNPPIRISMPNLKSKPVALKTILVAQTKKKKKKKKKTAHFYTQHATLPKPPIEARFAIPERGGFLFLINPARLSSRYN
jgi:hypothetical protein